MTDRASALTREIEGMIDCLGVLTMPIETGPALGTPRERVDYAAHIWVNDGERMGYSYVYRLCSDRGISESEIEDGAKLGKARQCAYRSLRSSHGDPAYGGGSEWNHNAAFDRYILERSADPGVGYMRPSPGVREMWQAAADVLRKYSEVSE